ncbi:DUF4276 family protein [Pseudomonas aeruginosa]|uniref:DUF4276 family protein n=1 Tax=Pseudomonas aeruginosa TaxID=287 RepID=UPI0022979FC3|nr:DUF4276 family protein [Pseudomonas aeruginosa]MCT5435592.1 DUF4276 family protein [Pseudomonas aeruginosa]MDI2408638.1 DUF4276 family protein [Pseudomonas aeruginosa]MDI4165040.1 DUF4276 family protein [Pseudomonas aeruginosa]MDY1536353.1 DUF4276 family protein [Pseudomonas aeruginosa]HBO7921140.1 DUF4276 family protein [Pseudomonas aeruginosa]
MVKLYVEGGGDAAALKTACREGFAKFLGKAGLAGRMPRVVACGSRSDAYDSFRTAIRSGEAAMLLVDSEAPVAGPAQQGDAAKQEDRGRWLPWLHLQQRQGDGWEKPDGSEDLQCHLMVQCMEAWLLADRETLMAFFGQGFKDNALPAATNRIESVGKQQLYDGLAKATRDCKTKGAYGKGEHSFKLLALVDPAKVMEASPWARRFVEALQSRMAQR